MSLSPIAWEEGGFAVFTVWLACAALAGGCVAGWVCWWWCRTRLTAVEAAREIERQARLVEQGLWAAFTRQVRDVLERRRAQLGGEAAEIDWLLWEWALETEEEL